MLTPVFDTAMNLYKMASNDEVFYLKRFGIVDRNIFEVWVVSIRFHLEGRNYVRSDKILAFEVQLCQLGLQDILKWKNVLHELSSSHRIGRFRYLK